MYLRITKPVPTEGLREGDIVKFMDEIAAKAHVAAGNAIEVVRKTITSVETGAIHIVEHTFLHAETGAEHVHDPVEVAKQRAAEEAAAAEKKE